MKRKNLLIAAALAAACNLPGEVIERWTFEGTSPEVGVNGGTMDVWQDHSPNSVPTPGVLRYANYADSSTVTFANPIDTTSIRSLKMTIEVTDLQFNASEMIRFIFDASGTDPEVEFTAWSSTTHTFAPDVEYNRDNDDLDVTVVQLNRAPLGGSLLMTVVWDFDSNTMSFETSGAVVTSGKKIAGYNMAASIGTITGFRIDGTHANNSVAFLGLDSVMIEVDAGPEIIEQWVFDGASPEVGVNEGSIDVWEANAPNSVPSTGVLRYETYADSSTVTFANPIDTSKITNLKMTVEVTDLQFNAGEMIRFIFAASGEDPEVEFTAWNATTHTFAPDIEYNNSNDDLDVTVAQLIGQPLGGPLLMTIVWDFVDNTMSFATSGMVETYGEKTAVDDMAAIIGTITGFRIDGTNSNNATAFVNLDTVTVEVNAGQVEARNFDFIEDFENGKHAFIPMGHVLEVASVADARSGDFVMVAQLTNASAVPDSTGVSLFQTQWFFETDQEYWVGMSTKLGDDFNYGSFDDQGVLVEWNYYNWENNDDTRPRPLVLRYTGDVVEIDSELIGLSGLKTVCSAAIDEWVDWVFHVKIAASGGIFEVWRNGVKVVDWAGDNCLGHNPDGAYLNYGLYSEQYDDQAGGTRMPVGYSRTVFHDEVRLDDADGSYASVTADGVLATIQPAQYETFQPPAAGQWFTDPAFGTRIKRLTDEQNVYGWNGERAMFSPDDQYFVIALNQPNRLVLFDGRTGAFLRDLSLSLPDYSIVRWWYDEVNDKQMLAYASGTQLMAFNVDNEAEGSVVLHDFGEQIGDSNGRLCNGDGNDFDDAGDWLLINAGDKMFPFNLRTLTKGVEKVMVASDWDYCTMSPSGDYIVGVGQVGSAVTDKGVFIWNRDWSGQRRLSPTGTHIDLGYLNGKEECLIARINKTNDGMDWWNTHNVSGESMLAVRLSDGEIFEMLRSTRWFSPIISAVRGSNSRHTYLAIPEHTLDPAIEWHRYFGELVQVSLDAESGFAVRRFAHHRCRQSVNGSHWTDQPEAWINHTGDRLFFRSNMDNYIEAGKHDLYMIELED